MLQSPPRFWEGGEIPPVYNWLEWKQSFLQYLDKLIKSDQRIKPSEYHKLVFFSLCVGQSGRDYFQTFRLREKPTLMEGLHAFERLLGYTSAENSSCKERETCCYEIHGSQEERYPADSRDSEETKNSDVCADNTARTNNATDPAHDEADTSSLSGGDEFGDTDDSPIDGEEFDEPFDQERPQDMHSESSTQLELLPTPPDTEAETTENETSNHKCDTLSDSDQSLDVPVSYEPVKQGKDPDMELCTQLGLRVLTFVLNSRSSLRETVEKHSSPLCILWTTQCALNERFYRKFRGNLQPVRDLNHIVSHPMYSYRPKPPHQFLEHSMKTNRQCRCLLKLFTQVRYVFTPIRPPD